MAKSFKIGDHVTWNSKAGYVGGKINKVHTEAGTQTVAGCSASAPKICVGVLDDIQPSMWMSSHPIRFLPS